MVDKQPSIGDVETAILRKLTAACWERKIPASYAPKVLDRLLRVTWATAIRASDRVLTVEDFYTVFDEVTTVPVPRATLNTLEAIAAGVQHVNVLSPDMAEAQFTFTAGSVRVGPSPPLLGPQLRRIAIENNVVAQLRDHGVSALYGATGTGKSVQATMLAQSERDAFLWVNCRDSELAELRITLAEAGRQLDARSACRYVVLDDVDMTVHERVLEEIAPGLLYTLRRRKGGLLFTAHLPLAQRLRMRLGIAGVSDTAMPAFTENEVSELLREYGLQDTQKLDVWAKLILAKTSGHPQLVAARVAALAQAGFPPPSADDILTTPREIADAREQARLVVSVELSREQKELLYRLSLLTTSFARPRALAIAEIVPPLHGAGDVFDRLVGPWIERPNAAEYRLSPLLTNSGSDANGPTWTRDMQAAIADAWLRFREQSPWDVATVLFSAVLGGNMPALVRLAMGLGSASEQVWQSLGQTSGFFVHFYTGAGAGQGFPAKNAYEVFCARWLQLQLAARASPTSCHDILERVDAELSATSSEDEVRLLRHMFLLQTLTLASVELSPARLVRTIAELAEGRASFTAAFRRQAEEAGVSDQDELDRIGATDMEPAIGVSLLLRIKSCEALMELFPALDSLCPETRAQCLSLFRNAPDMARQFADGIWLVEHESLTPRWALLSEALGSFCEHAVRWGEIALAQGITSVRARILHEQLGDDASALSALSATPTEGPASYLLTDVHAKILLDQGDPRRAADLWRGALAQWQADPNANVVGLAIAARNAGIAVARMGDWSGSGEFFERAAEAASEGEDRRLAVGLVADAAYAWFRADDRPGALRCAARALRGLASIPNTSDDLRSFYLHKVIGHVMTWMARKGQWATSGLDDPPPGACSNLDPSDKIQALEPTPIALSQANLLTLAQASGEKLSQFEEFAVSASQSGPGLARYQVIDVQLNEKLDAGDVGGIPNTIASLMAEIAELRRQDRQANASPAQGEIAAAVELGKTDPEFWMLYLCKGLLALAGHPHAIADVIFGWRADIARLQGPRTVTQWIDGLERLSAGSIGQKLRAMESADSHWSQRVAVAALILAEGVANPRALLRAHATLLMLNGGLLNEQLKVRACAAVSAAWRLAIQRRFALVKPEANVPKIREACDAAGEPTAKIARIFLAAMLAVDVPMSNELTSRARAIAGSDANLA